MKLAVVAAAVSLAGCTNDSPLDKVPVLIWVDADPSVGKVQVEIDPTDYMGTFADAVEAGDIEVRIDDRPLVLDPQTGYKDGAYTALFDLTASAARATPDAGNPTGRPQVLITDGVTTWHAQFNGLFTNDLAPVAPITPGDNTFEWESATHTNAGDAQIQWGCLEVVGRSDNCATNGDPATLHRIAQQYISLPSDAKPGDTIVVTAERWDYANGDNPQFTARIRNRYTTIQR